MTFVSAPQDHVIVIFGAAGDLAKKKLLPAFHRLWTGGLMPERWRLIGTGRTERSDEDFRDIAREAVQEEIGELGDWERFAELLSYTAADFGPGRTEVLAAAVADARRDVGDAAETLAYLSTPPSTYHSISAGLVESGLVVGGKVVFEKPFGRDRDDAAALARSLRKGLDDHQVFLIDHFLGKEAVQDLLSVRFANGLFEPVWNRHHVDHVQIDVLEAGDVGSRGDFFEETGTVRDMLTTHLLHVLSFAAMDPPPNLSADAIATEVEKVFASITPLEPSCVVRGQYEGYRDTPGVAADSDVETFSAARVEIRNHRWNGVPFILRTGKALAAKRSGVTVVFKAPPREMFPGGVADGGLDPNRLMLDLDRPGSLKLGLMTKESGWDMSLQASTLGLDGAVEDVGVGPYERLLHDALMGDRTLFTSIDAVDAAWQIVERVLADPPPLHHYAQKSWGPAAADRLIAPHAWALSPARSSQ